MNPALYTLPDANVVLFGQTGSRLYGLDHPGSDYDWKGVYQAPTTEVLATRKVRENFHTSAPDPDMTVYELGKFVNLLVKGNPTVIELLFLPRYEVLTETGRALVDNRHLFLSSSSIGQAYHGFAHGQRKDLDKGKRTTKVVKHLFRVVWQGRDLLHMGHCKPHLDEELVAALAQIDSLDDDELHGLVDRSMEGLKEARGHSILPERVDLAAIDRLLVDLRVKDLTGTRSSDTLQS